MRNPVPPPGRGGPLIPFRSYTLIMLYIEAVSLLFLLAAPPPDDSLPPGILARGEGIEITESAYHTYLTSLYRHTEIGGELLGQLINEELIEQESDKRGIRVSQDQLEHKVQELELQVRMESGGNKGLSAYLLENDIHEDEFFDALRLSIAHEQMARADFGVGADEEIPVEKLNIWLKDLLNKTDIETTGLEGDSIAQVNGKKIGTEYFGERLVSVLSPAKVSSLLTECIGIELIQLRAEEMGITFEKADADNEVAMREARLKQEPGLESVSYAAYLEAVQGISIKTLKASKKFRSEVLLKKICDALHHEAYLHDFFEENRDYFNQRFGRAARLATIFLRGVEKFPNQLVQRTYSEAMEELAAIKKRIERGEVTFDNMARVYSEHESKSSGGDLGFIAPGTPGWEEVADAAALAAKGAIMGPMKTEAGCHLFMVSDHRENPAYETIKDEVAREARQRYYQTVLKDAKIQKRY